MNFKYGVVIDSGSSGSRVMVYRWVDPLSITDALDSFYNSPPLISTEDSWTERITPGVSTFGTKPSKVWKNHYRKLIRFAESIVPAAQIPETLVYVLSTAGMRLLPDGQRNEVLHQTCKQIQRNSRFLLPDCSEHVEVIDGLTEGVYGWLALNYLMGLFAGTAPDAGTESVGFLDMGGASTQIAFVPSPEEISKHDEDLATVVLRKNNGDTQVWRVFVATWLGFGANQARSRHLSTLIHLHAGLIPASKKKVIRDPCMPRGAVIRDYEHEGTKYIILGIGSYEQCLRDTYPLLMKHLPCSEDPCLFNGVHAPKMDFERDKFVGVSEYWYSANDIFHSGGEYNYHTFNQKVQAFCDSSWETVQQNAKNGDYMGILVRALLDTCFKATWVLNVLHEGFGLPRLKIDISDPGETSVDAEVNSVHVPFNSAQSVAGTELSWTLGKILLVAASQIPSQDTRPVGITGKTFVDLESDWEDEPVASMGVYWFFVALVVMFVMTRYGRRMRRAYHDFVVSTPRRMVDIQPRIKNALASVRNSSPEFLRPPITRVINYMEVLQQTSLGMHLEEGTGRASPRIAPQESVLRTRPAMSFANVAEQALPLNLMNKPFFNPKTAAAFYQQ
ncbi:hypothetical protein METBISCDRAFT_13531 [Metschnikowia bicuspidata]|uniref:Nucleoside phosphatase GDA1/CD39 n=1 Tax=Metschnikowia bicuspidata TaxID=27322 RepID=A0A4P9ZFI9_9ASCO|nr:hypothetical protein METBISCDRAFT_13531 [Metschnikowia bicuspidata]